MDFRRELGDQAPLSATVTRVVGIRKRSGLKLEAFTQLLYQARAITKERAGSIRTAAPVGERLCGSRLMISGKFGGRGADGWARVRQPLVAECRLQEQLRGRRDGNDARPRRGGVCPRPRPGGRAGLPAGRGGSATARRPDRAPTPPPSAAAEPARSPAAGRPPLAIKTDDRSETEDTAIRVDDTPGRLQKWP